MSYTINLTNGSIFATVADGTINTDSSVTLIGKNYAGYGEFLGENFIHLLESGANSTAPTNPLTGQLWYDSSAGLLKVYNGTTFKILGAATSQSAAPTSNVVGDLWFDTVNSQLNVYDGTSYILVGPSFTAGTGTSGAIVDTVQDNLAVDHVVIKLYAENSIVAIVSKDTAFTLATPISGFSTIINPGIQLATTVNGNTPYFVGQATDSQLLQGIAASGFISSTANDSTTGILSILNDSGLIVGLDSDAQLYVNGTDVALKNVNLNAALDLQVNVGGVTTTAINIDGATGNANVASPTASTHIANKIYVDNGDTTVANNASAALTTHESSTTAHGATSAATPNLIMARDAYGRAKVAAPAATDDIARLAEVNAIIPSGTAMLFMQASAPVGWTKSTVHNDKAIRIVSGTSGGTAAGTVAFTSAFAGQTATGSSTVSGSIGNTTLTIAQMPSHNHYRRPYGMINGGADTFSAGNNDVAFGYVDANGGSGSHTHSFAGTGHSHSLSLDVQYVDAIICTKN